jgi:hypothetical protein
MRMVNKSEQKTVNIGDLVQWASDGVDQFDTPRRVRAVQMHDQQEWAFVEGTATAVPMSELTVVSTASPVMEKALSDSVASPLMSETCKRSAASLYAQHAAKTADRPLPTGAGPGRRTRHFTAGIRLAPEKHIIVRPNDDSGNQLLSRTSSFTLVLAFALGAIASAAGIYAFDVNPSLGPPPVMTATPPLLPSPMPAPPPAPVIVEAPLVVPNAPVPPMTSEIWEVQERLEFLGMQPGSPDGIPGYRTFNAIRR